MLSPICEIETQLVRALRLVHAKAEAGARHEGGRRRIASRCGRIVTMGVVRADVPVDIIARREPQSSSERRHLTAAEIANAGHSIPSIIVRITVPGVDLSRQYTIHAPEKLGRAPERANVYK